MPSLNFDDERGRFKEFYEANVDIHRAAAQSLRTLLGLLLADHDDFATPQVSCRVKDRDECIAKFQRKYQAKCEEGQTPYEIKNYISDLVGLRITCLYETDVPRIRAVLMDGFQVVDETDKIQAMEMQEGVFGYKGLHLDLKLLENRRELPEYRRFKDLQFEVQLRTTIQDAWSVLDHKIKYKKNIPHILKRRINRLAALFELADQEFLHIRDETQQIEAEARAQKEATPALPTANVIPAQRPLDVVAFLAVVNGRWGTYTFADHKVDGFVSELLGVNPELHGDALQTALDQHEDLIQRYRTYQSETFRNRLNPYTQIRHALYVTDKDRYSPLLFDLQRTTFDSWLNEQDRTALEAGV